MKLIINTDARYTENEITVNCRYMNRDIEKLIAFLRMLDKKMLGLRDNKEYVIEINDIIYIESTDKLTFIYTLTDTYESPFKLYELEGRFTAMDFLRVNRNCLINVNYIRSIETELNSRLILTMPKDIKLIVSRQYASEIKQKLEVYHV
jgi:two-component system, LytTR family, response regulator LytT